MKFISGTLTKKGTALVLLYKVFRLSSYSYFMRLFINFRFFSFPPRFLQQDYKIGVYILNNKLAVRNLQEVNQQEQTLQIDDASLYFDKKPGLST